MKPFKQVLRPNFTAVKFNIEPKRTILYTIREFFQNLPEPYRTQAFANVVNLQNLDELCISPKGAMRGAFVWSRSNEGQKYWSDFSNTLIGP